MAKRFVVKEMVKYQNPYPYIAGLLLRTSGKIGNVHLKQRERATGKSGYNFKKLLKLWINGFTAFSMDSSNFSPSEFVRMPSSIYNS